MMTLSLLGLAGCALILVAALADWRQSRRYGQPYITTTLYDGGRVR